MSNNPTICVSNGKKPIRDVKIRYSNKITNLDSIIMIKLKKKVGSDFSCLNFIDLLNWVSDSNKSLVFFINP